MTMTVSDKDPLSPLIDNSGDGFQRPRLRTNSGTTTGSDSDAGNSSTLKRHGSGTLLTINDFVVMGKLGEGGYGTVLLSRHKVTGLMCALKVLLKANIKSEVQAERVLSEAKVMGGINHPYIVSMNGAFQDPTHIFFVLEYVGGGDLYTRLRDDGAMGDESGKLVCAEVALALGHVHSRGYMYRDLKSENVLCCLDGHIKLADFGLAKRFADKRQERETRATGGGYRKTLRHSRFIGTPSSLAPEVMDIDDALGPNRDYGASVDWWGLGILACEIFTGLEDVLVASAATSQGRKELGAAFEKGLHLNETVIGALSEPVQQFVRQLLTVDVSKRLGCSDGLDEVKRTQFFANVNFDAVLAKDIPAPLVGMSFARTSGEAAEPNAQRRSIDKIEENLIEFLNTQVSTLPASHGRLATAALSGNIDTVRSLIAEGEDVDTCDIDMRTALHLTASKGVLEAVQYLVNEADADVSPVDRWGRTPLDDAIQHGQTSVRAFLESKDAKRGQARVADGQAELCDAAAKGDLVQLNALIEQGLPVNMGDYDKRTALHLAASEGLVPVVRFLIDEASADPSPVDRWGGTPLDDAQRSEHSKVVDFLTSRGAKGGKTSLTPVVPENVSGELCEAAAKGDVAKLTHLVSTAGVNVNEGDYDRRTAIHLAASEGLLEVVECLVKQLAADPSPVDRWGNTPLDDALRSKHNSVAALLRSVGAKSGHLAQASLASGISGTLPATVVGPQDLCDAAYAGDVARLRTYVAEGLDPNQGDYDRRTALHLAASEGQLDAVVYLINEAGVDPSPLDRWGGTPLDDVIRTAPQTGGERYRQVREFLESKGGSRGRQMGRQTNRATSSSCVLL